MGVYVSTQLNVRAVGVPRFSPGLARAGAPRALPGRRPPHRLARRRTLAWQAEAVILSNDPDLALVVLKIASARYK